MTGSASLLWLLRGGANPRRPSWQPTANASVTVPQDPEDAARLIQLFLMEKALYEVRYELDTRPEWLRIPIAGLFETLQPENPAA